MKLISLIFIFNLSPGFGQSWEHFTESNSGLASNDVRSVCPDQNGIIWFGTDRGLSGYNESVWITYSLDSACKIAHNSVYDIYCKHTESGSEVMAATDSGASLFSVTDIDDVICKALYRIDNSGLISNSVLSVTVDSAHNQWFGTDSGLSVLSDTSWISAVQGQHLENSHIVSLGAGVDGWVYAGTDGGGVGRLRLNEVDAITSASVLLEKWSGLLSNNVNTVFVDKSGKRWYGTDLGISVHESHNSKDGWEILTTAQGLPDNFVQAIAEDSSSGIWIGTKSGAARMSGNEWRYFTTQNGLLSNDVRDICITADSVVWIATDAGVSKLSNLSTTVQSSENGGAANFILPHIYPNPFNSRVKIALTLAQGERVQILIYDVLGRNIRALYDHYLMPGKVSLFWDGRNSNGTIVPSGVYFFKVVIGAKQFTHKISFIQ